jgi:hypothetical protein
VVRKNNGEFGFRIHGSRPVVVSAIEKGTAAESSGLEVGDVIVKLNGVHVLESSHSDIVKLAHSGPQTLEMDVIRTISSLTTPEDSSSPFGSTCLVNGFLLYKTPTKMTVWKKRFFSFSSDGLLSWFRTVDDSVPLGVLKLKGCRAHLEEQRDAGTVTRVITIRIRVNNIIILSLQTASTELAVEWMEGFNSVLSLSLFPDHYFSLSSVRLSSTHALAIPEPDCAGLLGKFSHVNKVWRQRYFVLKDGCLFMYEDVTSTKSLGALFLQGYRAQSCSMVAKKNTFELMPPSQRKEFRHYWFMADSEVGKKR